MENLPFKELAEFIREWSHLPPRKQIAPGTQFERDLGITGDDGCELLEAVEKRFDISLSYEEGGLRKTFNLGPNEFLFHSEGFELFPFEQLSIFGRSSTPTIRSFTVGELYDAVQQAMEGKHRNTA
jgi:acyl carrier protein